MLELNPDNAAAYLREHGWLGPGPGPVQIEALTGGVSNLVLRVRTPERTFVLKQSCPQLRTQAAWFSDLDRIYREQEVMEVLHPLLPAWVPEVLFSDRANFVFAMSHAPEPLRVWKQVLLAGEVDAQVGAQAGQLLGRMHELTARDPAPVQGFTNRNVFIQLRVEPFYRRIQERYPDLAATIEPLIQQLLTRQDALCHGDFSPKNILVHPEGFTLVDYETCHLGDPTMDLGFFLSHLLLKAVKLPEMQERFFELIRSFWQGYAGAVTFQPAAALETRGLAHLGICLLARIDGTSPVDYLGEESQRATVRRLGRRILQERTATLTQVLALTAEEMARDR